MALPVVKVTSLPVLQALAVVLDPHQLVLDSIDSLRNAPAYLAVVDQKVGEGWICGQKARIRKAARVAGLMIEIEGNVLPLLHIDAADMDVVRRLGAIGNRIHRLGARSALHTPARLSYVARPFSTVLLYAAREAIKGEQGFTADGLDDVAARLHVCLHATIDLEALPTARVASLGDLQALGAVRDPHDIDIVAVDAVRDAPDYLNHVLQKKALGWSCDQEPRLKKVQRFATLLRKLDNDILPTLQANPANKAVIRSLRSTGEMLARLKRRAPAAVVALADPLSNRIRGAATSVLKGEHSQDPASWLLGRLEVIRPQIVACLDAHIDMEDGDSEDDDEAEM